VQRRAALANISAERVLRECEALLITILGSTDQNEMRFASAQRWEQLKDADFLPRGIGHRVSANGYTDPWLLSLTSRD
jgi:hypothetical protein